MIKIENVNKYFNRHKKNQIHVINNTSIELGDTGLVALLGPSGCGKTTLLNAIGGLDKINSGKIFINGKRISKRSSNAVDKIRNLNIGYIFQEFNLVDDMSVYDNVALSLRINGIKDKKEIKKRVDYVLTKVGMYKYRNKEAGMLSGGERQRVGVARAIVKDPSIIIADEPTGNLDSKNTIEVMNIIKAISKNRLVILVTHENELAEFYASRIIKIQDGCVIDDIENKHTNDLDYRIDNKIYLKDIENKNIFKKDNIEINCYIDDKSNKDIKLNIVVKNGNIYIESNDFKIETIDNNSSIELVDDSYKKINTTIFDEYNFDFDKIVDKNIRMKYSSIFNPISLIKNGFMKVLNYSFIKKLLLFGFFASAMFITYSFSSLFALNKINESKFVDINKNYLLIEKNKISKDDLIKFENDKDINYALPGSSKVSFNLNLNDYYQTYGYTANYSGSLASVDMVKEEELLYGRLPKNSSEIVIDKIVYESTLEDGFVKQAGILSYEDLVGKKLYVLNNIKYTLVGIVDTTSPSIYAYESEFINIVSNSSSTTDYYYDTVNSEKIYDYKIYDDDIKIVKGKLPLNDYEVIVNEAYQYDYPLNKKIDYKVNDTKLKVVGYYSSKDNIQSYLTNNNTIKYSLLDNNSSMVIYSKDKTSTIEKYRGTHNIKDSYEYSKEKYIKSKKESSKASMLAALFILSISLIEIYLMIRSSFLSRVKEVGIFRAIGMKKVDIYKMFAGEIISITTFASLPGVLIMSYILTELSTINFISDKFVMNPLVLIVVIMFVYIFNLLVGLLPVYKTIRKTPAQILSRYDL